MAEDTIATTSTQSKKHSAVFVYIIIGALVLVAVLVMSGGGGSNAGASGPSSAELNLEAQQNNTAAALQEAQIQANSQQQSTLDEGVLSTVGSLINNDQQLQLATINSNTALNSNSLNAQVAEYEAYLETLGNEFGTTANLQLGTIQSNNQLSASEIPLLELEQEIKYSQSSNGIFGSGMNIQSLLELLQLQQLFGGNNNNGLVLA